VNRERTGRYRATDRYCRGFHGSSDGSASAFIGTAVQ